MKQFNKVHLSKFGYNYTPFEIYNFLKNSTIFDKIEFSGITKEQLRDILNELREKVKHRTVFLDIPDEEVLFFWFKNRLHPMLKHAVVASPRDKTGCSESVLSQDNARDALRFYENGQQNFDYTLQDIIDYCEEE